ncbi:MAG: MFS transporter [Krumholzibacteria bacterium]|nr:MFS transporter [Candidatus Krumholzibacteria bacterium]
MPEWFQEFYPVLILLVIVGFVFWRLPSVDVGHDRRYTRRRVLNWLPLGLTYALLYMGRYNLKVSQYAFEEIAGPDGSPLMGNTGFGIVFMVGTIVYGVSFLINGPLTDRLGGRFSMLTGTLGATVMNLLMGLASLTLLRNGPLAGVIAHNFIPVFSVLYAVNMYFQSFGAVAIVKVNAPWFHVRERGVFGAIFGILIALGIYFAYDLGPLILDGMGLAWVFLMPALLLAVFWVIDWFVVRNSPADAGLADFNTGDATSGDDSPRLGAGKVFKMMLTNPVILTIAGVEFCSGFLRQAIMQWYPSFAKQTDGVLGLRSEFVYDNWGLLLCIAGIMGGVFAGFISDHVFQSRRGPVAGFLYGLLLAGAVVLTFTYTTPIVGWLVVVMSMAVIGVHGMLSGTASMDFGGAKNAGIAVGIIDGFVYLGTGIMSLTYALVLPKVELDAAGRLAGAATDPANWRAWPVAMIPIAAIGLFLALRLWNAKPKPKGAAH